MDKDFVPELKGSLNEAIAAKQQIAKYFKHYGDSDHEESKKHQLIFAIRIMRSILKCDYKHIDIYSQIITEIFSNHLQPEASVKYWTLYVKSILSFHYMLVEKKDFQNASLIFKNISTYKNKLQEAENAKTYVNIYCYHLFLQNMLKSINQELAQQNATEVLENLTQIFKEILETNIQKNFQYSAILEDTLQWLFPRNSIGTVYQFLKILPKDKVKQMFESLFTLYGRQRIDVSESNEADIQKQARFIIKTIHTFLQIDIMDKMQLQLAVMLLSHCRTESRLQTVKPIAELLHLLYDYIKLLCAQNSTLDFQRIYVIRCGRFLELLKEYSEIVKYQPWFGDLLVLVFYTHSQLQNNLIFNCFWKQMNKPECYKAMFQVFMELMKLSPCISADTQLLTINCCTSPRKHVMLSFAQIALTCFALYCQNISESEENKEQIINQDNNLTDYYKEAIQNTLVFILKNAFKISDGMDCISSNSQEIEILLTRFKQATLNCKTHRQAGTCITILELFLKIKPKIPAKEWSLLLRRLYKTVSELISYTPQIGREIQMCYIASMLDETISEIDIIQIRTQISIFYATSAATNEQTERLPHEMCLMHIYLTSARPHFFLRPHLQLANKKLLHWLESQQILKYYKTNTALLHSLLKSSQSHYDFVIVAKTGKLQKYAMAKISSLYESLKRTTEYGKSLSRLELLTFGHVCVMILNETISNQKFQTESKDFSEEKLNLLLHREEMATFTIQNDKKRLNLVWEAFRAFEDFYKKFDSEKITMDEAIIDWESLMDDLANLAFCLQLSGYTEQSLQIWLLHYKCSRLLQDSYSSLRGLAFFSEYSEHLTSANFPFKLDDEINCHFPFIIQCLENLPNLARQTYQNYILLVILQIAYYNARLSRYSLSQMLLQYVEIRYAELPERRGRYDIIMATMDAIKFRLLWKHFNVSKEQASHTTAENVLLHRCLLRDIEETLDRFHDFSIISSNDGLLYSILLIGLVQEFAECTANRLCDNFINLLFVATCKSSLLFGLALRFVQILSMWMRLNLQMECVEEAQTKLKIIEYVLGIKSLKEVRENSEKHIKEIQSSTLLPTTCAEITSMNFNPGMEAIRKLAQVELSPIKADKLQLHPSHRNFNLKSYLEYKPEYKNIEQIEWIFFTVGCLRARLYFLVEDYDQLEEFYEYGNTWLEMRQNEFNKKYYIGWQLMALQHYVNFLRASRKYDKAQQLLVIAIELCKNIKFNVDVVYYINFQLQMLNTTRELDDMQNVISKRPVHSKLRRQLQFNISPENYNKDLPMSSSKKSNAVKSSLQSASSSSSCSSAKKANIRLDKKTNKTKQKPRFKICEDSVELINSTEDEMETIANAEVQTIKSQITIESNELYKTPKVSRKPSTRSTKKVVTKSAGKTKRPQHISSQPISIDLTDSSPSSPSTTTPPWETNKNLNSNELIAQMQNLEIKEHKKSTRTTTETKTRSGRIQRTPLVKQLSAPLIVVEQLPLEEKPKPSEVRDKSPIDKSTVCSALTLSTTRPRTRQRKVNDDQICLASATTPSSVTTRRKHPKNIL